mmetsp:Transcript_146793/g.381503  ORF Transcript_146793/g.381503 Transcript_146793/m.381503 type:complete len:118 (+) Transcript_146793:370-723(+)
MAYKAHCPVWCCEQQGSRSWRRHAPLPDPASIGRAECVLAHGSLFAFASAPNPEEDVTAVLACRFFQTDLRMTCPSATLYPLYFLCSTMSHADASSAAVEPCIYIEGAGRCSCTSLW